MYVGKSLDGFDYAIRTLFRNFGANISLSPDCFSHRVLDPLGSILMRQPNTSVSKWEFYLPTLFRNIDCTDDVRWELASDFSMGKNSFRNWSLLGEIALPDRESGVMGQFCSGPLAFLLCRRDASGTLILCNPLGCHYIEISDSELTALLSGGGGFVLSVLRPLAPHPISKAALWREVCALASSSEFPAYETILHQPANRFEHIRLQYALFHYRLQRAKMAEFYGLSPFFSCALERITGSGSASDLAWFAEAERIFRKELGVK